MSKQFSSKEAYEYYQEELSIAEAARRYCKDNNIEYTPTCRKNLSAYIHRHGLKNKEVDHDLENETTSETGQYNNVSSAGTIKEDVFELPSAWSSDLNRFLSIEEYCETFNLPYDSLERYNLVCHNSNHIVFNVRFKPTLKDVEGIDEEFIESVVKEHLNHKFTKKSVNTTQLSSEYFDRLVITDVHLNMNPTGERNTDPLYNHSWEEEDVFKRLDQTIEHVVKYKKGNILVVDELGDFMDGLDGKTTRGGHDLPQNSSDKDAFRLGIKFKVYLVDKLVDYYDKLIFNSVTNDNHSFLFGYFVNFSAQKILEQKYLNKVKYNIQEKFLEHYVMGKHTFIITHGKDSGENKFGMKATFDAKAYEKIDQYCKNRNLYNGNFIELSKGDSHQRIFDTTSTNDFSYHSYGAFSPPSNWVGTNYKDTKSSIDFFNISYEENIKINIPLIF